MAHTIYEKDMEPACPRCKCAQVRIATYHFGSTYSAECAFCGFGQVTGDNEAMAVARLRGQYFNGGANVKS